MLRGFGNILVKELKELIRDPKIIIGMIVLPLIMFPVLGLVLGYAQETAKQEAMNAQLLVVNNDNGNWSQNFIRYLSLGLNVTVLNNTQSQQVVDQGLLKHYNQTTFLEIPFGFSDNMTIHLNTNSNITATINTFSVYQGGSIFSGIGSTVVGVYVNSFNRAIAPDLIKTSTSTIIKNEIQQGVDPSQLSALMISQTIALPITIMILLTYAMQIAATSVAMEKEEKTLETLLTMPVDRFSILMGKLSSTIIVAGVAALAVLFGYNFMLGSISSAVQAGTQINLANLGLVPSPLGIFAVGHFAFRNIAFCLSISGYYVSFQRGCTRSTSARWLHLPAHIHSSTRTDLHRRQHVANSHKSNFLRNSIQPTDNCIKSSDSRRLWHRRLWHNLRCHFYGCYNVHCLKTFCNGKNLNCQTAIWRKKTRYHKNKSLL